MLTQRYNNCSVQKFYGTSGDTKPTDHIENGSEFYEIDTGKKFYFNKESGTWIEGGGIVHPNNP